MNYMFKNGGDDLGHQCVSKMFLELQNFCPNKHRISPCLKNKLDNETLEK